MEWFWLIICFAVLAIIAFFWFLGYNYKQSELMLERRRAENERLRADGKSKEAEIYAKPKPDTWRDTTDRL